MNYIDRAIKHVKKIRIENAKVMLLEYGLRVTDLFEYETLEQTNKTLERTIQNLLGAATYLEQENKKLKIFAKGMEIPLSLIECWGDEECEHCQALKTIKEITA